VASLDEAKAAFRVDVAVTNSIFDCTNPAVSNNGDCVNILWTDGLYFVKNEGIGGQANLISFEFNRHFMVISSRSFADAIVPRLDQEIRGVTGVRYFFVHRWPIVGEPETRHASNLLAPGRAAQLRMPRFLGEPRHPRTEQGVGGITPSAGRIL
jgi:hypothetical protein